MRCLSILLVLLLPGLARAADTTEDLVARLAGEDATAWSNAYTLLQRRKDPAMVPMLLKIAPGLATTTQSYAVYLINALPQTQQTRAALLKMTRMKPPYLRARAAKALYDRGERGLEKLTIEIITEVKANDTQASLVLGALIQRREPEVVAALRTWLDEEPSEIVFARIVYCFHLLAGDQGAVPLLQKRSAHDLPGIRGISAAYLMAYGPAADRTANGKALASALATGELSYSVFIYVNYCLAKVTHLEPALLDVVAKRVPEESGYYAARLLDLLSRGRYGGLVALARKLLDHEDRIVSNAAFAVLGNIPGGLTRTSLAELLASDDLGRRLQAAESLRRMDDLSGRDVVFEVLRISENALVRRDAAKALGQFPSVETVAILLKALADDDALVRYNATSSLNDVWATMFPYRRFDLASVGWAYAGAPAARAAALAKIKAWWVAHKDARW